MGLGIPKEIKRGEARPLRIGTSPKNASHVFIPRQAKNGACESHRLFVLKTADMEKIKSQLPTDFDWRPVTVWRKNRETWKQISARTGIHHQTLREAAAKLKKTELLGFRDRADWDLIKILYRRKKSLDEIAAAVGLTDGHSLSANITKRRMDGRWRLPKRPHIYHPPSMDKRSPC
jgi:hypothetical protein